MAEVCKVFLLCSGLGRVNRGYESFTRECFAALRSQPGLDLTLFKGGGAAANGEITLWNIPRFSLAGRLLGRLTRRGGYVVEQASFFLSLKKYLRRDHPDVLYFSDGNLGNLLWHGRRKNGLRYRLLFSNGGPLSPPFPRWDLVQQVASPYFETARQAGQPDVRQLLLPYGFAIPNHPPERTPADLERLRAKLGLPVGRPIVLSVGALNASHKRMDYLVREVAMLPHPRPFLVMLGQHDAESAGLAALAEKSLGRGNFLLRRVSPAEISDYYAAADVFTLASLHEGFGRVLVEALAQGLPCLAHDYAVAREVLAETGFYADFRVPGALAGLLAGALAAGTDSVARQARHRSAHARFSWDVLAEKYVAMLRQCAVADILNHG
jgi:1,2-diacylglycerol 3-alpha-glucosyltransferase